MKHPVLYALDELHNFAERQRLNIDHIRVSLHGEGDDRIIGFTAHPTNIPAAQFAIGVKISDLWGDCPPALRTQPTPPEVTAPTKSVEPGASEGGAAMLGAIHDCASVDGEATTRENRAVWRIDVGAGYVCSAHASEVPDGPENRPEAAPVGETTIAQADQRTMFEQLIAEGRPSTVEVKATIETLEHHAEQFGQVGFDRQRADLRAAAAIVDRLGCALIAQDLELEDANKALDTVARAAIPLDDADVAELCDRARRWVENTEGTMAPAMVSAIRTPRDLVTRLVGALLDQARKAQALRCLGRPEPQDRAALYERVKADPVAYLREGTHDTPYEEYPYYTGDAISMVLDRLADTESRVQALRADLHRVQTNTAQYRQESRNREETANRRAADCEDRNLRLRAGVVDALAALERGDARTYDDAARAQAVAALQADRPGVLDRRAEVVVDMVAEALGMRRA